MQPFSVQTIHALAEITTGGSAYGSRPAIGLYRSGPQLERFLGGLNVECVIGNASRVPRVTEVLSRLNQTDPAQIVRVLEAVADPRDFLDTPDKHAAVVEYLNQRLSYDGYELRQVSRQLKLVAQQTGSIATQSFDDAISALDFDSVSQDLERALTQAESDPAGALTAACSTVESVCKCILDEMGKTYPARQDIRGLVTEVTKHLNLSPSRDDLPADCAADIKQILGGLASVTGGIGALRTHAGDAHGRGRTRVKVDGRIARLAIHAASTVSLFFIETWNRQKE